MCPPGYHNGYAGNHVRGHMMYGCNIIHHVPKYMSCHGRAHCFHHCIYIMPYDHLSNMYIHRQVWEELT